MTFEDALVIHFGGITLNTLAIVYTMMHFVDGMISRQQHQARGLKYEYVPRAIDQSPFGYDIYLWPAWVMASLVPVLNYLIAFAWLFWYLRKVYRMRQKAKADQTAFKKFMCSVWDTNRERNPLKDHECKPPSKKK